MTCDGRGAREVLGSMLTGLHDYTGEYVGDVPDLMVHGPKESVLDLVNLLKNNQGVEEISLRSDSVDPYPYAGSMQTLKLETTDEDELLVQRVGTTLKISGAREYMQEFADDVRDAASLVGERSDSVIVELNAEPYMAPDSASFSVEIYEPH